MSFVTEQAIIEAAFEDRAQFNANNIPQDVADAINTTIQALDQGHIRVAEKIAGDWVVNEWIKKAVLLSFVSRDNSVVEGAEQKYYDKVPMKYADYTLEDFQRDGARIVPPAAVRQGCYIANGVVLMPS